MLGPLPCGSSFPADVSEPKHYPVTLPLAPWLFDHHFNGQAILPAVEIMQLLARAAVQLAPSTDVLHMTDASFNRLLALAPGQKQLELTIAICEEDSGVRAQLFSRQQFKTMARMVEHGEVFFGGRSSAGANWIVRETHCTAQEGLAIGAERVYRELVPFGPAFRTLSDKVTLQGARAQGTLKAPGFAHETNPLGSPFPMDGAMHAACVHGQWTGDFIPFPVGFAARIVHRPTEPGEQYQTCAYLLTQSPQELVYNLEIRDAEQRLRESIHKLRMRDVTAGRLKPPGWIKTSSGTQGR